MELTNYRDFILQKVHTAQPDQAQLEFEPKEIKPFQRYLVQVALGATRYAIFADTGLGKTLMQLTWAKNVVIKTGKPVLILAPLAVCPQTAYEEAPKFNIDGVTVSRDGSVTSDVVVTNYEQLVKFNPNDFGGVVVDESSILKSMDGEYRNQIVRFMRKMPYRCLFSATPAPNDYHELGSSSEALGIMGRMEMMSKYFRNTRDDCSEKAQYGNKPKWQFRGHSEKPFWEWVATWSAVVKKPSDVGFDDGGYDLPPLTIRKHCIEVEAPEGMLFAVPTTRRWEQVAETNRTVEARCKTVLEICNSHNEQYIVWCNSNKESNLLREIMSDAVEISGSDSDEKKLAKFEKFRSGAARGLITKPKIGAWGLNFQFCRYMTFFPDHSYEKWYQCIRRCYRYGQEREVFVDIVYAPAEVPIMDNMEAKEKRAVVIFEELSGKIGSGNKGKLFSFDRQQTEVPQWLM